MKQFQSFCLVTLRIREKMAAEDWVSVLLPVVILLGAGLIIRLKVPAGNCGMSDMEETFGASKNKSR